MSYQIIQGDSAKKLKEFAENSIDLVVTSPPYDNLRTYNGYTFEFEPIADQLARVLKPGGVIVWIVNDATVSGSETGTSFKQALYFKSIGLNLHDTMIYLSDKPPLTHNRYEQKFEYMFVFSKGRPNTFNPIREPSTYSGSSKKARTFRHTGEELGATHKAGAVAETKIKGNAWFYPTGYNKSTKYKDAFKHPAIFPEQLALDHIQSWSNPGDLVLDPFLGSGTTGVAALQLGRQFIGIEISPEYCQLSESRIRDHQAAQNLLQKSLKTTTTEGSI